MLNCDFITIVVSVLASSIAKGKTENEIAVISSIFTQLRDTLAIITTLEKLCKIT